MSFDRRRASTDPKRRRGVPPMASWATLRNEDIRRYWGTMTLRELADHLGFAPTTVYYRARRKCNLPELRNVWRAQ